MRYFIILLLSFIYLNCFAAYIPQNGDIIFQSSQSKQSKAVELATHSPYSHMGIIFIKNNKAYVFEASSKVTYTELQQWINRGIHKNYVIKRLQNKTFTKRELDKLYTVAKVFLDKPYDIWFGWSDEYIYCSELVWKIYDRALNIQVGKLEKIKDFDLSSKAVQQILKERYGNVIPYNETVISPVAMYNSPLLITVDKQW